MHSFLPHYNTLQSMAKLYAPCEPGFQMNSIIYSHLIEFDRHSESPRIMSSCSDEMKNVSQNKATQNGKRVGISHIARGGHAESSQLAITNAYLQTPFFTDSPKQQKNIIK